IGEVGDVLARPRSVEDAGTRDHDRGRGRRRRGRTWGRRGDDGRGSARDDEQRDREKTSHPDAISSTDCRTISPEARSRAGSTVAGVSPDVWNAPTSVPETMTAGTRRRRYEKWSLVPVAYSRS